LWIAKCININFPEDCVASTPNSLSGGKIDRGLFYLAEGFQGIWQSKREEEHMSREY
jgi:hypothetical protein